MPEKAIEIDDELIYEKEGGKARIILNRPERMNALSIAPDGLIDQFEEACLDAEADDDIRVIIIKGNGPCFSAGYDISDTDTLEMDGWEWEDMLQEQDKTWEKTLLENSVPSIAQVHSYCLAGAGHMICHADIVYAAENAKFGYPAARFGSVGAHQLWPHYLGIRKARELLYTGNMMSAEDAKSVGYINRALPEEELEENVEKLADQIIEMPEHAVRFNKKAINRYLDTIRLQEFKKNSASIEALTYGADPKKWPRGFKGFQKKIDEVGLRETLRRRDDRFDEIWGDSEYHRGDGQ